MRWPPPPKRLFPTKPEPAFLRHIVEDALLDVMYELPSLTDIGRCVVHKDAIDGDASPRLYRRTGGRHMTLKTALSQAQAEPRKKSA